ncbi:MAG: YlxR family protein [Candidatus Eremiobacteraeota bacterium]|nr:YlxR family protein [Candidatus Eremiobacteraeota bacterium]
MAPIRTCVGCRRQFAQPDLVRFTRAADGWHADGASRRRRPGRGAYLCSAACAERARKNRRYPGLGEAAAEYGLIENRATTNHNHV